MPRKIKKPKGPRSLNNLEGQSGHALHFPKAYAVRKRHYGMTLVLRPVNFTEYAYEFKRPEDFYNTRVGAVVTFRVGMAFCSPDELKYDGVEGVKHAVERLDNPKSSFSVMVPLNEILRGRLARWVLEYIESDMFPARLVPTGLRGRCEDYGYPYMLLCHRHAHYVKEKR